MKQFQPRSVYEWVLIWWSTSFDSILCFRDSSSTFFFLSQLWALHQGMIYGHNKSEEEEERKKESSKIEVLEVVHEAIEYKETLLNKEAMTKLRIS